MPKRTYSKRHGGYLPVKAHKRKKGVSVKGYCRRPPRGRGASKPKPDMPF